MGMAEGSGEMNARAAIIRELDKKYNAYCEKKVREAVAWALEEAAKLAENHDTFTLPERITLAAKIRALKLSGGS